MPFYSKDSKVNAFLERALAALRRNPKAARWNGGDFLRDAEENDYDRDNFLSALLHDEQHPILNKQDKFTDNLLFAAARQYSWGIPKKGWVREQTETGTQDKAIVIFKSGIKKLTSNGKNKAIQTLRGVNSLRKEVYLPIELEALDVMVDYCNQAELILGLAAFQARSSWLTEHLDHLAANPPTAAPVDSASTPATANGTDRPRLTRSGRDLTPTAPSSAPPARLKQTSPAPRPQRQLPVNSPAEPMPRSASKKRKGRISAVQSPELPAPPSASKTAKTKASNKKARSDEPGSSGRNTSADPPPATGSAPGSSQGNSSAPPPLAAALDDSAMMARFAQAFTAAAHGPSTSMSLVDVKETMEQHHKLVNPFELPQHKEYTVKEMKPWPSCHAGHTNLCLRLPPSGDRKRKESYYKRVRGKICWDQSCEAFFHEECHAFFHTFALLKPLELALGPQQPSPAGGFGCPCQKRFSEKLYNETPANGVVNCGDSDH